MEVEADPVYQTVLLQVERIFWRCVQTGEPPKVFGVEPPKAKVAAVKVVDMAASNSWAEYAAIFPRTRCAYVEHENAKCELKALIPEDAREAFGHGVRAKRSKAGAISFDLIANGEASMRSCSDSIAQLAAALAKAQIELVNPVKTLTGVIDRWGSGNEGQSYRYAPLSAGLEIIRKTLCKHELAVIQTTEVDRESGMVMLTTTLAHGSGEWISALWPCAAPPT